MSLTLERLIADMERLKKELGPPPPEACLLSPRDNLALQGWLVNSDPVGPRMFPPMFSLQLMVSAGMPDGEVLTGPRDKLGEMAALLDAGVSYKKLMPKKEKTDEA